MGSSPTVSVLIPCYNSADFVSEAIESALAQDYEPTEIIVVDDGSTDGSKEQVRKYSDQVRLVVNEKNRGEAYTCNRAIQEASGELIKILHADDLLCEGVLVEQVWQLENVELNTIVYGDVRFVSADGTFHHRDEFRPERETETRAHYLLKNNPHPSSPLHHRDLLLEHEGFDPSVPMPDYDFHLRLALAGVTFQYAPGDTAIVRIHGGADRVQNQDHFARDPEGKFSRIEDRWARIREKDMLSDDVKCHLAREAWHGGREALRRGYSDLADRYFDFARRAHMDHIAGTSSIYKWCVKMFGPAQAEEIGRWKRKVIGY